MKKRTMTMTAMAMMEKESLVAAVLNCLARKRVGTVVATRVRVMAALIQGKERVAGVRELVAPAEERGSVLERERVY